MLGPLLDSSNCPSSPSPCLVRTARWNWREAREPGRRFVGRAKKDWTWSAWPKRSGGLDHDPDYPADADWVGGRAGGFPQADRRLGASVPATSQSRPNGGCFGGFFESAAQGVEVPRFRGPRFLAVSKTPFHRALCLVANRCETPDLRDGRPSTPVAALECQAGRRPSCR